MAMEPDTPPRLALPGASARPSLLASPLLADVMSRFSSLSRRSRILGFAIVVVAVSAGGAVWAVTRSSTATSAPIEHSLPFAPGARLSTSGANKASSPAATGSSSVGSVAAPTKAPPPVVVDVGGAVVHPGVYKLDGGSRVADALAAAGGVTLDGDDERLNKAEKLSDGVRIFVPHRGVAPPAVVGITPSAGRGTGGAASGGGGGSAGTPAIVNLNTADAIQLDSLPGVGPATAAAIVQFRTQHGPFASVDKLTDVPGIGPAKLERLRSFLTV